MRNRTATPSVLAALLLSSNALANSIVWELRDVVYDDGGTASGTFTLDTDTGQLSDVNVVTTDGTVFIPEFVDDDGTVYGFYFPGSTWYLGLYDEADGSSRVTFWPQLPPDPEYPVSMALTFSDALDSGLGSYAIERTYSESYTDGGSAYSRSIISGYVTAVPLPAAAWLFGSALMGLGWIKRKS